MAEKVSEPARIHPLRRECVSGRVPQHMEMEWEWQPSSLPGSFNHASNAHAGKGLAALIDEDVGFLAPIGQLLAL
jgi:hypothetical protein